jgi:serine carboxypeptidase 1
MLSLVALAIAVASTQAQVPDEDWGYVTVRPGAHSFWWLYGANTSSAPRETLPLILWLQGGPGASSTGYGNFAEMGPLDWYLQPRASAWTNAPANLLFVDNPVGAGFSYVDSDAALTKSNADIAADLVALLAAFFARFPALQATPFYVFTESYGGKMAASLAPALLAAVDAGTVKTNFKGYVMGDSWIDGTDHVDAWCPFLYQVDLLDDAQLKECLVPVQECNAATARGDWQGSINAWGKTEGVIGALTDGVDFYNILKHGAAGDILRRKPELRLSPQALALAPAGVDPAVLQRLFTNHLSAYLGDPLDALMNGPIRAKLKIIPSNVTWGSQSDRVFSALSLDFMKPVYDEVDAVLAGGRVNVTVAEGQLDLICSNLGAQTWMRRLTWEGMAGFYASARQPRYPSAQAQQLGATSGFIKRSGVLSKYDGACGKRALGEGGVWGSPGTLPSHWGCLSHTLTPTSHTRTHNLKHSFVLT